jgi:hypothetical protein
MPAPFGPSREKIVPTGDGQVDAVEHDLVTVGLAQPVRVMARFVMSVLLQRLRAVMSP